VSAAATLRRAERALRRAVAVLARVRRRQAALARAVATRDAALALRVRRETMDEGEEAGGVGVEATEGLDPWRVLRAAEETSRAAGEAEAGAAALADAVALEASRASGAQCAPQ
jgi:hypothetical protein